VSKWFGAFLSYLEVAQFVPDLHVQLVVLLWAQRHRAQLALRVRTTTFRPPRQTFILNPRFSNQLASYDVVSF